MSAIELAQRLAITLTLGPALPYRWNGSSLRVCPEMTADTMAHEVAHWVVCEAARRQLPEYGLGTLRSLAWYESDAPEAPRVVSDDEAEHEEWLASVLGVAYLGALGLDWRRACCWVPGDRRWLSLADALTETRGLAAELRKRGLLTKDGIPTHGRLPNWKPAAKIR